jgi:hypothetical protein
LCGGKIPPSLKYSTTHAHTKGNFGGGKTQIPLKKFHTLNINNSLITLGDITVKKCFI